MTVGAIVRVLSGASWWPGVYAGEIGGGLVGVHRLGRLSAAPEMVLGGHVDPWHCLRDGHAVDTWTYADAVRRGHCEACQREIQEGSTMPTDELKVVCGMCEGTRFVATAHQRAAGLKPSKRCPTCGPIIDEMS